MKLNVCIWKSRTVPIQSQAVKERQVRLLLHYCTDATYALLQIDGEAMPGREGGVGERPTEILLRKPLEDVPGMVHRFER